MIYANADLSKASQHREVLAFADYWRDLTGAWPAQLVFDQRLTTQPEFGELDARGITFITLRMRSASLQRQITALHAAGLTPPPGPPCGWTGPAATPPPASSTSPPSRCRAIRAASAS